MTLAEVKIYLRVDYTEDDDYINSLIEVSQIYIDSMVGEVYKTDTKAVKLSELLQKKLISDMYESRGTEVVSNTKQDRIVNSILDKLSNYIIE
ncbi:phage gp6-like head-tail connector protein [Clostridium sp. YIM B02505]|uniref:Phage gp6-like head-tail connector protein n=1 Tax=Clostridium yunnanense TaxID=2800325 RepID=A0ABS1EIE7_9CLOT|nr:head-tail connector protein [Clostridium yunnanense]MBK1809144.1 phage gp6-like head-tail connector protein [Clostridium yunnanense]